jgi:replicative DNA helicase
MIAPPDQLVPYDTDAEEAVLGSLLLDSLAIIRVASFLDAPDFYREKNRWVYESAMALYERREAIDFLTVRAELERRKRLDDCGGMSFLTSLINIVPTSVHIEYYGRIVWRAAIRRRLISAAQEIATLAHCETEEIDATIGAAEAALFAVTSTAATRADFVPVGEFIARLDDKRWNDTPKTAPLLTGLADLDHALGGLVRGEMTILAGRPGMGKTSALNTFVLNMARKAQNIAFVSLEMKGESVTNRLIRALTGIPSHRLRLPGHALSENEVAALSRANGQIDALPVTIDEKRTQTVEAIRRKVRELHHRKGLDLVVVDFIQLAHTERRFSNRNYELEHIAYNLFDMAGELDCHVLVASQLSRETEKRDNAKPRLSDLRDSGAIEQAANNVIGLWRSDYYDPPANPDPVSACLALILKQRDGRTQDVDLGWWGERSLFVDLADVRRINQGRQAA